MPAKIRGPFDVKLTPQPSNIADPDPTLGRMTIAKTHQGDLEAVGTSTLSIRVVPDSGEGELTGIAGTMTIKIEEGKHSYEFEYTLPDHAG